MNRKLLIILAGAAVLRIVGIGQPLWYDEAYTAMLVKLPIDRMVAATLADVHPPTWYLIDGAFCALFGYSEVALRLPSLILGLVAVGLIWRLGRDWPENTRIIATVLMAVSPFQIYYSNEARMYALLTVAVLLATIGIMERRVWLTTAGIALTLLSHNMSVIYMPILGGLALWRLGPRKALFSICAGSAAWVAWLPALITQAQRLNTGGYWIADVTGNSAISAIAQLNQLMFPPFTFDWIAPANLLISSALIVFPLIEAVRLRNRFALGMAALAFGPVLVGLAISLIWQPMLLSRSLIGCLPAWLALIAWWITLPRVWNIPRIAVIGLACCTVAVTIFAYFQRYDRTAGLLETAAWLSTNSGPDDIVCHSDNSSIVLMTYYFGGRTATLDVDASLRRTINEETTHAIGIRSVNPAQCDWLIHINSPLMSRDIAPFVERWLVERNAERVRTIYQSRATNVYLWRLH